MGFVEFILILSRVKLTLAPSFSSSFFRAIKRSVSFIFRVFNPESSQFIPKPKQETAIVCAISGESFKSNEIDLGKLKYGILLIIISSSIKVVLTPNFS